MFGSAGLLEVVVEECLLARPEMTLVTRTKATRSRVRLVTYISHVCIIYFVLFIIYYVFYVTYFKERSVAGHQLGAPSFLPGNVPSTSSGTSSLQLLLLFTT